MSKSMIKNALGDTVVTQYLPMTSANAHAFAEAILAGTFAVYELNASSGSDNDTMAYDCRLQFRDSTTGKKGYMSFIAKSTWNTDEVQDTLIGETINGILIDEVVIIGWTPMYFA